MNFKNGMTALLASAVFATSAGIAMAQDHDHGDHGDGHDQRQDQRQDQHGGDHDRGPQGHADYHFRPDDRNNFRSHYQSNLRQWQNNPRRPRFNAGDRLPSGYRIQAVPTSYYRGVPPPPPGYRFGYYDGYVVSYNPTTRIIADVLDLVTGN